MDAVFFNLNLWPLLAVFIFASLSIFFCIQCLRFCEKRQKLIFYFLFFISIGYVYFSYCHIVDKIFVIEVYPNDSIHDVLKKSEWPFLVDYIYVDNDKYIEMETFPGVIQSFLGLSALKSGMPAYVFDLKGNILDYTNNNNDDNRYLKKWGEVQKRTRITVKEALKTLEVSGLHI